MLEGGKAYGILGCQWGDEGKGKLVDALAEKADVCARFNGGSNAGHTVQVDGKTYALRLIPSGILHKHTLNFLGAGVVIHIQSLMEELAKLQDAAPDALQRLFIAKQAHLTFDFHRLADSQFDLQRAQGKIGTTGNGIGPTYSAKHSRIGLRVEEFCTPWKAFETKYRALLATVREQYKITFTDADADMELAQLQDCAKRLRPQLVDSIEWIHRQLKGNKKVLVEGANAAFLDIDHGTYPFVTASCTTAGGMMSGLGIPPTKIQGSIGVVKAYTTRVGQGPFITELPQDSKYFRHLSTKGREIGTNTKRLRRCGWLDCMLIKRALQINGCEILCLTKVDVLSGLDKLRICVAYKARESNGDTTEEEIYPVSATDYENFEPVYEEYDGWTENLSDIKQFNQLPAAVKTYIKRIEEIVECPIALIGVGPSRENLIQQC